MTARRVPRSVRGQSLVELAMGVTVLLLLMAGTADLGRAFYSYLSLRDAAQEGAAYGSIAPADVPGIRLRVRESSSGPIDFGDFTDDQILIQVDGYACSGYSITVTVEYRLPLVAPFLAGSTLNLSASATDTILQPPC